MIRRALFEHPLRLLLTGALAALPLVATVAVFAWLASLLVRWLGPQSTFGRLLGALGLTAADSGWAGYLLALLVVLAALVLLGALVEAGVQEGLARVVDSVLRRIPLVRTVYDFATRLAGLLERREPGERAMQPVWCRFGGTAHDGGTFVLGLQSTPEPVQVQGRSCFIVLVPTAPVPIGGGLLFVPQDCVTPAELSFEALTSLYVSMGVTAPQHLPAALPPRPEKPTP